MKTTLEQWQLLQAVVNYGSFARAAQEFNRSQSSLSYQLTLMQERLGVSLLTIVGRKAELTPEGQQLLAQAQPLLQSFHALENRASALKRGDRARLDLVVDSIFPKAFLFSALRHFQQTYPMTQVHLTEVLRSERLSDLKKREADVYLVTQTEDVAMRGKALMGVTFVAVAHKEHPLWQLPAPFSRDDLARYPLIEIVDRVQQQLHSRQFAAAENWTFTAIEAAIEAVAHCVGYGWLPEEHIQPLLASGELLPLPLVQGARRTTQLYLMVNEERNVVDQEIALLVDLLSGDKER
ncbi:LysR family transcriptional regulator [Buttiauxella gaviniae]|uniref:LysR family transcriptional regulator n=1 Tax=Buttiauxella gaviniae TaxID=82990 RepID=A0ABV3NZS2_9ENTR